ncbi:MAG: DUF86 domain-containing protein [Flavobacteriales bacterium]
MSKRSDNLLLNDIRIAIDRILLATGARDQATFESDVIIQDAVIRNFEVIGEAAKSLSPELRIRYPAVDWQGMVGFRNFLIYVYFGVDLSVVWTIIRDDIPILKLQLQDISE